MATLTASRAYGQPNVQADAVLPDEPVRLTVEPDQAGEYLYEWRLPEGSASDSDLSGPSAIVYFEAVPPRRHEISVTLYRLEGKRRVVADEARLTLDVLRPASQPAGRPSRPPEGGPAERRAIQEVVADNQGDPFVSVGLRRTSVPFTPDVALWMTIRRSTRALSFGAFSEAMDGLLCRTEPPTAAGQARLGNARDELKGLAIRRALPFNDTDAYRFLKVVTEAYLLSNVGAVFYNRDGTRVNEFTEVEAREAADRLGINRGAVPGKALDNYLIDVTTNNSQLGSVQTLPYLALVRQKLRDVGIKSSFFAGNTTSDAVFSEECEGILAERLTAPLMIELIWSYWQEEGHLVQTMNAVSRRFQNVRGPGDRDPLANFEIDPLRPLNNLLWGYVQDEQHRLSVLRRAYEYDHHYGISLVGKAVGALRPADSRSKFLEGFHNLLYLSTTFFAQDDDTTVIADGFPLLNALREVHLELSRGAHNQFNDLTSTARQEMLIQQWLMARPEFREFLPTRIMVAYPEPWMDRVDAMKQIQGWTNSSVLHFHSLAIYGEQILLAIRYGAWTDPNAQRDWAANWARFWRSEIQGYLHAYRAVTGVDLSADMTDNQRGSERYLQPAVHLSRQLESQRRGALPMSPALPPARKVSSR